MKGKIIQFSIVIILTVFLKNSYSQSISASPNPFQSSTTITIDSLDQDTVSLSIYNMLGSVIMEYFNNMIVSGTVAVVFNADTSAYGIYLAVLRINGQISVMKLAKGSSTTGITNAAIKELEYQLFPNPTMKFLTVNLNGNSITSVKLFDLNGRLVKQNTPKMDHITIDLTNLDNATYIIIIETSKRTIIDRVIKN